MGLTELVKTELIVPEYKFTEVVRELYEFEWFHVEARDAGLDERVSRAHDVLRRLSLDLDTLISSLNISIESGLISQLVRKQHIYRERIEVSDIEELIEKLKSDAEPIIREARDSIEARRRLREDLKQIEALLSTLKVLLEFNIDLARLQRLKRFYSIFTVVETGTVEEIKRSLPTSSVIDAPIGKNLTALLIVSLRGEEERVDRVLRGFGVKPFTIPSDLPQNIDEAYGLIVEKKKKYEEDLKNAEESLVRIKEREGTRVIALKEAIQVIEELLNRLGRKGELKRFRIIHGYIPKDMKGDFELKFGGKYGVFFEESSGESEHHHPTLLNNKGVTKSFENITLIQGYPRSDEIDPTPYVAVFFSIFYGIMFADLGQGLILALFGLYMYKRVVEKSLKEWAKLLTTLGFSAAIAGFILGEAFGFKMEIPFFKLGILHLVGGHGGEAQFNMGEVLKLIQFTLFLGAMQLIVGYTLSFRKALKHKEYVEAFTAKLPTITMYVFGILFALCFFGAGGFTELMSSENSVPYLGVPTKTLAPIAVGGAISSMLILILGRGILEGMIMKEGGLVGLIGEGLLEVLENIIHFMSNSLSYVRITVLLLVHTALMMLLNASWSALGWSGLPVLIIGNLGIMALEGLMVFIQALRLHLYEFFTKFYEGTGVPFRKIKPETNHIEIVFK